ncbi:MULTISPECIES: response regulator transcription factor [unclassified Streptosporangium]|uniref:response regulator transcription factor n=1 Tax=unclassified Streptosporangium TaxID=2632669 RepID=UPI002E2B7526|nr:MULTISPECIES: response regulator transcription factor [unclassified Streptosporangium]
MIRVLVVEDQQALAGALKIAIDAQPDLECVGTFGTVEDAMPLATASGADVVLMDIHLPDADGVEGGIEGTRRIKVSHPEARVLILAEDATPDLFVASVAAGAAGFLAKDHAFADILRAIRASINQKIIMVECDTLGALLNGIRPGASSANGRENWARLTARELEVLALMGEGLCPRAIAERLIVSLYTARGHIKNVMVKLGAHSQLEAVVVAARTKLLPGLQARSTSPIRSIWGE